MQDIFFCLTLAIIPAAFSYFLDYCLGHPMSENNISTKAIFFYYSYFLAKKRIGTRKQQELVNALAPMLNNESKSIRADGVQQLKTSVMLEAQKLFKYEQALGMCPFCTNFWLCLFASAIFFATIPLHYISSHFYFLLIPIFSHLILRKL